MNKLPKSRTAEIIVQKLGNRVLIYDRAIDDLYSLDETSTIVYQACGSGQMSFDELKAEKHLSDEEIFQALNELKKMNLLEKSKNFPCASNGSPAAAAAHHSSRQVDFLQ